MWSHNNLLKIFESFFKNINGVSIADFVLHYITWKLQSLNVDVQRALDSWIFHYQLILQTIWLWSQSIYHINNQWLDVEVCVLRSLSLTCSNRSHHAHADKTLLFFENFSQTKLTSLCKSGYSLVMCICVLFMTYYFWVTPTISSEYCFAKALHKGIVIVKHFFSKFIHRNHIIKIASGISNWGITKEVKKRMRSKHEHENEENIVVDWVIHLNQL